MAQQPAVAIVGYSYRLPGNLRTDDDFWSLLSDREIVREPIVDRYGRGYRPIGRFSGPGRFGSPYEALIRDDAEMRIDPKLFGLSQDEMLVMDPQVRMLLGCSWEAIEHVGWDLHSLRNSSTGVFVGGQVPPVANWRPPGGSGPFDVTSLSLTMLSNRISYHYNLMGPSATYCTACSASLTALHAAMAALRLGDCNRALVGSVNYLGSARISNSFNALGVISPDGRCHSFDAEANGYIRSEGAFVFALKPLEAAERDGDHIHAVIEATAVNAAGAADGSEGLAQGRYITAPTRHAQAALMRRARARAARAAREIDYIEAHATGTVVGDRIEGNAIVEAFADGDRDAPLRVSSVKSNVGHMEAAAFHCGLLKTLLMMQRRTFAPTSRNFVSPNPEIDFERVPMQVQTACEPFPDRPVVVGINSFGFGGANGHCVVREYRPARRRIWSSAAAPKGGFMIPLSARTAPALTRSAARLQRALEEQDIDLHTLAGNLGRRRTHFPARTTFAVRSGAELTEALDAFVADPNPVSTAEDGERRIAMVFSGQGTQWAGCGRGLYETDPVFRRVVDAIEDHWREHSDTSLREACLSATQEELDEVQLAQPVIFTIQCGVLELLKTWGVHPDCVVGHSSGEVAAAYASGALSLSEATRLVYHRATLQQRTAGSGRMLAIGLDRPGVEEILDSLRIPFLSRDGRPPHVEIACENAPANVVVCGTETALGPVMRELDRRKLQNQLLPGNIAFHSTAMEPIRADALSALSFLDGREFHTPIPFVSSVSGRALERLDADYWWSNIRQPVRFARAIETIVRDHRPDIFLEIAPHSALQSTIVQCVEDSSRVPACVPTLTRFSDVGLDFQEALGALFRAGVALDFESQYPRPRPIAHLLPGHPRDEMTAFDHLCDDEMFVRQGQYSHGPLVGRKVPSDHLLFESRLSQKDFPWLAGHRVQHAAIMPAAGYIELVAQALGGVPVHIETLELLQPCPIPKEPVRLQTELRRVGDDSPDEYTFTISSRSYDIDADSEVHCRGRVARVGADHPVDTPAHIKDIDMSSCETVFAKREDFYDSLDAILDGSYQYGAHCQTIRRLRRNTETGALIVDVEVDDDLWLASRDEGYVTGPPVLLDAGLQSLLLDLLLASHLFAIPRRAEATTVLRSPTGPRVTCHVRLPRHDRRVNERGQYALAPGERLSGADISYYDSATGHLIATIGEYYTFVTSPRWGDLPNSRHEVVWQPKFVAEGEALTDRLPDGEIEPAALIAAMEGAESDGLMSCHVLELAGNREPEQTILAQCLDHLATSSGQSEYWLVADSDETTRSHYDAFGQRSAALRFASLDPTDHPAMDEGLLRPGAAEILFLHGSAEGIGSDDSTHADRWAFLHGLVVAGGLVLVCHDEGADGTPVEPGEGWTTIRATPRATLLQAPQRYAVEVGDMAVPGPRWVLGDPASWVSDWESLLDAPDRVQEVPHDAIASARYESWEGWPGAPDVHAIDFFLGPDPQDPTGEAATIRFMGFVQALVSSRLERSQHSCRLTLITQRSLLEGEDPRGNALWGSVRTMAMEVGEEAKLDFRLVDLGEVEDLKTLAWLARCDLRERELAVRRNRLWAPRLVSMRDRYVRVPKGEHAVHRLTLDNPGQIAGLEMKTYEIPAVGPHDVEIDVAAASLNFRDVMVTLGLLPTLAYERSALGHEVGLEGSGIVRRVGSSVRHCRVGDPVAFTAGGCIANRIVLPERLVFPKPERLSMEEAAAVLSVYVTSYYSLIHLARLRRGQRVLIHSAMGGVGHAAIALAKHVGAEIYTTAGSETKREQLMAMGARGAFDSHSHEWYDELMAATDGEGIDVVLNSLAGRHVELCLKALRPGGWHCEIGKIDIYADNDLGLRVFRRNLRFAAIDVDRLMLDDPELTREISETCLDLLGQGALPPLPITVFPYRDYAKALRLMTTGQHQGKLVLRAPRGSADPAYPIADVRPLFDPEATYLLTGGMGGFGLRLIPYMVAFGARHFTLLDRDPQRRRDADWIRRSSALARMDIDVEFDIVQGDVEAEDDVRRCVQGIQRPLKGVFHLAGALDDRLLAQMSPTSVQRVFSAKAAGALHLHRATAEFHLDHFVLFSSTASVLGNPGQANYSAANGFLDGLAVHRHRQGLPCLTYNMPAVADAGMLARRPPVLRVHRAAGFPPASSDLAIVNLDYALRTMRDRPHLITALFERLAWTADSPDYMRTGRIIHNHDAFDVGLERELTLDSVVEQIVAKVADLCGHEDVEPAEPLSSFGLTSISVTELGTFIHVEFGYRVSALELMTTASALSLASGVVTGKESAKEDQMDTDWQESPTNGTHGSLPRAHRTPSVFANARDDYYPVKGLHDHD